MNSEELPVPDMSLAARFSNLPCELQLIILKHAAEADSHGPPAYMLLYHMVWHVFGSKNGQKKNNTTSLERLVRGGGLYVPLGKRGLLGTSRLARLLALEAWLRAVTVTKITLSDSENRAMWDMEEIKKKAIQILEDKVKEAKEKLVSEG